MRVGRRKDRPAIGAINELRRHETARASGSPASLVLVCAPALTKCHAGDTALHMAAAGCRLEIVPALIANGADVRAKNRRGAAPLQLSRRRTARLAYAAPMSDERTERIVIFGSIVA